MGKKSKWQIDLTGQKFGRWSVLKRSDKKYYWTCECDCGIIKDVDYRSLQKRNSKGCLQCSIDERNKKKEEEKIGKKFGRLTIIKRSDDCAPGYHTCMCDCGAIKNISYRQMTSGKAKSCGCLKSEVSKKNAEKLITYTHDHIAKNHRDGTMLCSLKQKISKTNKSGVKGVIKRPNGRFHAYINFKRKRYHLGSFSTLEEAKLAREKAEEKFYKPILNENK